MGLSMQGLDTSLYFQGKYNDKRLATKLEMKYGLERDGRAYVIDNINYQVVHIATKFLVKQVVHKNWPINALRG